MTKNMANNFWEWFTEHNEKYLMLDKLETIEEKEMLQSDLISKLDEYQKGLFFEIGGRSEGVNTLIITAEGDVELFNAVRSLVEEAPKLKGWEIMALKPPMGTDFKINYEGLQLDPNLIWFLPLKNTEDPETVGLRVGFLDFDVEKEKFYISAIYIILDTILGEEIHAENVTYIEVGLLPEAPATQGYIELVKLQDFLDWKKEEQP